MPGCGYRRAPGRGGTVGASPLVRASSGGLFEELLARSAWHADALCKGPAYAGVDFLPEKSGVYDRPKAICRRCLVREQCAAYALANPSVVGVWGGTTFNDRPVMRRNAS